MTTRPPLRVLFFDVFGTCVQQRPPVADELWKAAQEALQSDASISSEVRAKATEMTYEKWFEFGGEWNGIEHTVVREHIAKTGTVDWRAVDQYRQDALRTLLARRGLLLLREDPTTSEVHIESGSLFDAAQFKQLATIWYRLPPWPDTCHGLELLNKKFSTVTLSNAYNDLMKGLVAHSSIPFTEVYTSDLFQSYKPNPKVYLGAAEKMGVKPEECALVAAHLGDLKGAKACGFYAIYVERPLEEKTPALREEHIPDLVIKEDEEGFVALAKRLGIESE